jgi:hypothetical protein
MENRLPFYCHYFVDRETKCDMIFVDKETKMAASEGRM